MGILRKLHNIVIHICGSASCIKEFKNLAGRLILLNNYTRWNSWYHMLHIALQHGPAVNSYTKKYFDTLKEEYLSPIDWEKLYMISKFLSLFNEVTLKTQGD